MDYLKEARGVLKAWVRHEKAKLRQLSLAAAADRLARRVRRLDALCRGFDPDEPRRPAGGPGGGEWTASGGGGGHGDQGATAPGRKPSAVPSKATRAAGRLRNLARRRRVLKAIRAEGELADAINACWLEDSEPADLAFALDSRGRRITEPARLKEWLRRREVLVRVVNDPSRTAEDRRRAEEGLQSAPLHFIEVKTLCTSEKDAVHMTGPARRRKEGWAEKYGAHFHVVALDRRRGRKFSGGVAYVAADELAGTFRLSAMARVDSLGAVLAEVCPECAGGRGRS
jgi:hypothetical protein